MRLFVREWGAGPRKALLVHGITSDSRAWWRVGPALAERGYHVTAIDLPGHGFSPPARELTLESFAEALAENATARPEIAIGHSFGALILGLAAGRLQPERTIYSDPAWRLPDQDSLDDMIETFRIARRSTRAEIRQLEPLWPEKELDLEMTMLAGWQTSTVTLLKLLVSTDHTPRPSSPSLVQVAGVNSLVSADHADELKKIGFEVRVVPGADHSIHRHAFDRFMSSLRGWI